jgi:predicted transcriptional regulator
MMRFTVRNGQETHRLTGIFSMNDELENETTALAANIVAAYVSHNMLPASDVPAFIAAVHGAVANSASSCVEAPKAELIPAISIKKSVTPDYIICLEDGKKFKSLKRHLRTRYDMTPEQYRDKWGLAFDYPMVAPMYSASRSELAKTMGLGQRRTSQEVIPAKATRKNAKA